MITSQENLLQIENHCLSEYPKEACGILAGRGKKVEKVYKMENVSDKPEICYFMKPEEQLKVLKEIRNSGMELLAIYHSHINVPAVVSKRDKELAFYPEIVYLILSLIDKKVVDMKGFRIKGDEVDEVNIEKEIN